MSEDANAEQTDPKMPGWLDMAKRDPEGIDRVYACEQATEILRRTRRIVARVMPSPPPVHGFYDPEGFIRSARLSSHRRLFAKSVRRRISAKVHARDSLLSPTDKAAILEGARTAANPSR